MRATMRPSEFAPAIAEARHAIGFKFMVRAVEAIASINLRRLAALLKYPRSAQRPVRRLK